MKIMVVGGGGREHAIIKKIKENKSVTEIFALPGSLFSKSPFIFILLSISFSLVIKEFLKFNILLLL